ncbi:hypothetical protein GLOTRDRAFT_111572, partial [Gloeophyllum trabeum ATCC 11539]
MSATVSRFSPEMIQTIQTRVSECPYGLDALPSVNPLNNLHPSCCRELYLIPVLGSEVWCHLWPS